MLPTTSMQLTATMAASTAAYVRGTTPTTRYNAAATIALRRRGALGEDSLERAETALHCRHLSECPAPVGGCRARCLAGRESRGVALFESGEKLRERDVQRFRDSQNTQEAEILFAALEMAHVGAVHSGDIGEGFLSPSPPAPQFPNPYSQPPQRIVHPPSVGAYLPFGLQHDR